MPSTQSTLLPKYLITITVVRLLFTTKDLLSPHVNTSTLCLLYTNLLLDLLRLLFVKQLKNTFFFKMVAASFVLEMVVYLILVRDVGWVRAWCAIAFGVFSVGWMVFLHPCYISEEKES